MLFKALHIHSDPLDIVSPCEVSSGLHIPLGCWEKQITLWTWGMMCEPSVREHSTQVSFCLLASLSLWDAVSNIERGWWVTTWGSHQTSQPASQQEWKGSRVWQLWSPPAWVRIVWLTSKVTLPVSRAWTHGINMHCGKYLLAAN